MSEKSPSVIGRIKLALVHDGQNIKLNGRYDAIDDRVRQSGDGKFLRVFDLAFATEKWEALEHFDDLPDAGKYAIGGISIILRNMGMN